MIIGLIALQVVATQPALRASPQIRVKPALVAGTVTVKQRRLADAQSLLARARRIQANYAPKPGQPSKAELASSIEQLKAELDSLSEMGEMESIRLQMAMDRMSKVEATLSNMLKKISDTQTAIVESIK